jgi:hypothetical protein
VLANVLRVTITEFLDVPSQRQSVPWFKTVRQTSKGYDFRITRSLRRSADNYQVRFDRLAAASQASRIVGLQNAVHGARIFGNHASKPSHHTALQAVCMQSSSLLGSRFANEPRTREPLSMQGHIILVVEPGLVLQWSQ